MDLTVEADGSPGGGRAFFAPRLILSIKVLRVP